MFGRLVRVRVRVSTAVPDPLPGPFLRLSAISLVRPPALRSSCGGVNIGSDIVCSPLMRRSDGRAAAKRSGG